MDCLFCKIIKKEIPSERVYEDTEVIAFKDLYPLAPAHVLFIHKEHDSNVNEMTANNPQRITAIMNAINIFTQSKKLIEKGFRIVTNVGPDAGQTVFHTHFHVLYGTRLGKFGA